MPGRVVGMLGQGDYYDCEQRHGLSQAILGPTTRDVATTVGGSCDWRQWMLVRQPRKLQPATENASAGDDESCSLPLRNRQKLLSAMAKTATGDE